MTRSPRARLRVLVLVACGLAIAAVGHAQPQDVLGIWFDQAADVDTLSTTQSPQVVTAYLLLANAGAATGVSGWECGVEIAGDGVYPISWEVSGGLNVAAPPQFQVGIGVNDRLFWAPAIRLATVRLLVTNPGATGRLYVHPYAIPSLQDPPGSGHPLHAALYAAGHDAGDLRPLRPSSGDEALPVAVINPAATPVCHQSAGRLDFGRVVLGGSREDQLSLANVGGGVLAGSVGEPDDPAFSVVEGGGAYALGPSEVRTVKLRYTPPAAGGLAGGLAACGAVALAGEGVQAGQCSVEPPALAFGEVGVGRPRCLILAIGNPSAAAVAGVVAVGGAGFAVTAGAGPYQVDPGQTHAVTVCFTPPGVGAAAGELDLGTVCGQVPLSGSGVSLPPQCALAGSPLDFQTVGVGAAAERTFTLRNAGGGTLTGAVSIAGEHFALAAGAGPFALAELESLAVTVRYAPTAPGTHTAQVAFGTGLCGPVTCSGGAPLCVLSADTLRFGEAMVGLPLSLRATRTLVIGNAGGGTLTGRLPETPCGAFSLPYNRLGDTYYALPAGSQYNLIVTFAPPTTGRFLCMLPATDFCGAVVLDGTGIWPPPRCELSAGRIDFGAVPVASYGDQIFTIRNPGPAPLSGEVRLDDPVFALTEGAGPFTLASGQERRVTVRCHPPAPGAYSCVVQTGAPACGDVTCVATSPVPQCSVRSASLAFGEVPLGGRLRQNFRLFNQGPGRLEGVVASECSAFRIVGDGRYSIPQYTEKTIGVEFVPGAEGSASCVLLTGASCAALPCSGVGVRLPSTPALTPPDSLPFGEALVGGQRNLSLMIRNDGGDTLSGTAVVEGAAFSLIGDPGYRLAWHETKSLVVRFTPTQPRAYTGTVRLGDDRATLPCTGTGRASPPDLIGIWFDPDGLSNTRTTTTDNELVTAWLLIRSPSDAADLASWECCVEMQGEGGSSAYWNFYGGTTGTNWPCGRVQPLTPLSPAGAVVRLARLDFWQVSPAQPTYFFIRPAPNPAFPGVPAYATLGDRSRFLPLNLPVDNPGDPVAMVNGSSVVPVLAASPTVVCAGEGVRVILSYDPARADACQVLRRVGDGPATALAGGPSSDPSGRLTIADTDAPTGETLRYSYALLRNGAEVARSAEVATTCAGAPPAATALHPVFPNPFNPQATVRFDLARAGRARVTVFDLAGRRVRTLCDDDLPAGAYTRVWDGRDDSGQPLPSGTYYARLTANGGNEMRKMALVR